MPGWRRSLVPEEDGLLTCSMCIASPSARGTSPFAPGSKTAMDGLIVSWRVVRPKPARVDKSFCGMQFRSAPLYSLGHGANDAQKTMGIIEVPPFALGATFSGGRIVHAMGSKVTQAMGGAGAHG